MFNFCRRKPNAFLSSGVEHGDGNNLVAADSGHGRTELSLFQVNDNILFSELLFLNGTTSFQGSIVMPVFCFLVERVLGYG